MKPATLRALASMRREFDDAFEAMRVEARRRSRAGGTYAGAIRARKGKLVQAFAARLVDLAWVVELGGEDGANARRQRLTIEEEARIQVPIQPEYLDGLPSDLARVIKRDIDDYTYGAGVDLHVRVDGDLVMALECKAYTENAMFKRVLWDFKLLRGLYPDVECFLLQLESMLGGDYSSVVANPLGSFSSHTIMSYFPEVPLRIVTLLDDERRVGEPIDDKKFQKPLTRSRQVAAIEAICAGFRRQGLAP